MIAETNRWPAIDQHLADLLLSTANSSVDFEFILKANREADLPEIEVSPLQGKLLQLLIQISGSTRVLEIGTHGGYSTAWMATAMPTGATVMTIEKVATHAGVAAANLKEAGLSDRVTLRLGTAINILNELIADSVKPFDFVFIDADKANGANYFEAAIA